MFGLKIFVRVQTFRRVPPVLPRNFCHPVSYIEWTYRISHAFFWEWLFLPDARRFPSLNRTPLVTARHLRTTLLPPSESLCPLPSQASLVESRRVLVWKILRVQGKGLPPAPWLEQGVPCSEPVEDPSPSCTPGKATPVLLVETSRLPRWQATTGPEALTAGTAS